MHLLVAAEYLAKGYKLSDKILQRAIQVDGELRRSLLTILPRGNVQSQQPKKESRNASSITFSLSIPQLELKRLVQIRRYPGR